MTIIAETTDTNDARLEPIRPIYGPSDPRWAELADWMRVHADPGKATIEDLVPTERACWHETRILGRDLHETSMRVITSAEYPEPPSDSPRPNWATERVTDAVDGFDEPLIQWSTIASASDCGRYEVALYREDTFHPDTDSVEIGPASAVLWIGGNSFETTGSDGPLIASPGDLRTLAAACVAAAEHWEATQ